MSHVIRSFVLLSIALLVSCEQMSRDIERDLKKELLQEQQVAAEENKALVRRLFEEVWNQGNLDVIDEIFAADYVGHMPGSPDIHGPEAGKQFVTMFRTAFPDIKFTVEDQIAEGDKGVTRWTYTATHKGEWMGIPPSGVQVALTGISIDRFAGGKIVESWDNLDDLGLFQQLGMELKPKEVEK